MTILQTQMPAHTHSASGNTGDGNSDGPTGAVWARAIDGSGNAVSSYAAGLSPVVNTTLAPQAIGITGGGQPVPIMDPFLCLSFIIALEGIFPSRS